MKQSINISKIQRGQSLVEFAISLTLLLTLLAGAVDFGSAFFSYIALRDAAQEGALFGSICAVKDSLGNSCNIKIYDPATDTLNSGAIESRVRLSSSQPLDLTNISEVTVNITATNPPCAGGGLTVTVSYNYKLTMPFIGAILGKDTIPLASKVTDTILKPACP